ncbi:ABC transporter substrate-binding protein [bacterium]|nr:ABC transporter substrate-binding protein [bacterium]
MMKQGVRLEVVLVEVVFFFFCVFSIWAQQPTVGSVPQISQDLKIGILQSVLTLDPQKAYDPGSQIVAHAVGQTLYCNIAAGKVELVLADSLPEKQAENMYRLRLKSNARFHNGEPVTTADVIYTIERLKDPLLNPPAAPFFARIRFLSPVDETRLDCSFAGTEQELVSLFSRTESIILSQKQHLTLGQAGMIGSGPFSLKDWLRSQRVVLKRHSPSWDDQDLSGEHTTTSSRKPLSGQVILMKVPDAETLYTKLLNRTLHLAIDLQPEQARRLAGKDKHFMITLFPSHRAYQLYLNRDAAPLDQVEVRQALSRALDRVRITNQCLAGYGRPLNSPLLPEMIDTVPAGVRDNYTYQPERARNSLSDTISSTNPGEQALTLIVTYEPLLQSIALELQKQLHEVGLIVNILPLNKQDLLDVLYNRTQTAELSWHMALEDWYDWRLPDDPLEYLKLQFQSSSKYNKVGFVDLTVDTIFREMSSKLSESSLATVLHKIADDCTVIPLLSPYRIMVHDQKVRDLNWDSKGVLYLDRCWIEK